MVDVEAQKELFTFGYIDPLNLDGIAQSCYSQHIAHIKLIDPTLKQLIYSNIPLPPLLLESARERLTLQDTPQSSWYFSWRDQ